MGGHFGWTFLVWIFSQYGRRPFLITENFQSHCSPFHINTQLCSQNGRRPFWMNENNFWSHFSPFHQYETFIFFEYFSQNGRRRPFWMTENHFRSHFSPFQINKYFKMAASANFGYRILPKSIGTSRYIVGQWLHQIWNWSVHFLLSYGSAQAFSSYFHKMATGGHFDSSDFLQNW